MVGVGAKVTTHSWQNSSVCPSCPPKRGQVTRSGTVASLPVEGVGRGPSPTSMTQGPALWTGLSVQNPAGGADSEDSAPSALGAETPGSGSYSYWCQGPRERVEDAKAILPLPAETEATAGRWHSEEWMGVGEGAGVARPEEA